MSSAADMLAKIRGARAAYARNDSKAIKLKEGKTRIRILQKPGDENFKFWHDFGVHWIKADPESKKPLAVVGCHDASFETECAVCTLIDKVASTAPDDETVALAKSWKPKRGVLVNALIRSGDAKSETPVVLDLTRTTFDAVMSIYENFYEENSASLFDPKDGLDLIVERKGKGLDTEYQVTQTTKAVPVPESALDTMADLEAFIQKEYFRPGEEAKALGAITRLTGVSLHAGALAGPSRTSGLLTGSGASVVDADLDDEVIEDLAAKATPKAKPAAAKKEAPKEEKAAEADEFDEDLDVSAALEELDGLDD